MVKVLYLIDKIRPAGAQKHLAEVVLGLDRARFEPRLMTLEDLGVKRIYGFSGVRGLWRLARLMKKERFDIVHTYLFSENILGVIAAKIAGVPVIITGRRDTGMLREGKWQHILAYRLTNRWVDRIVCVSEAVRSVVLAKERVEAKRTKVIHNGVDCSKFVPRPSSSILRRDFGISDDDLVVGMIANFSWIKGHEVLIEAAPEVIREVPDAKFVLVGEGPEKRVLELRVASSDLKDKIIFTGRRTDVPQLLGIVDVSVNLSYSEGMSNTILESMAAGLPVVATAVDGNLETVDEETGILVPPKDPKTTAEAIITLLKDEKLRKTLGENARRRVQEEFDARMMIGKMERLYVDLLNADLRKSNADGRR